uniref:GNAT family N-acetyltransferase n=1 Tax=Steinernema glaseri TaxID=37863 RepID=A0A1I7YSB4_9BILA
MYITPTCSLTYCYIVQASSTNKGTNLHTPSRALRLYIDNRLLGFATFVEDGCEPEVFGPFLGYIALLEGYRKPSSSPLLTPFDLYFKRLL